MTPDCRRTYLHIALLCSFLSLAGCAVMPEESERPKAELPVFPPAPEQARFYFERTLTGSADVVEDEKGAAFRRMVTGEQRTGEGMAKPYGVAAWKGRIHIADTGRREVLVLDIPARRFRIIGGDDPGALAMPLGLDVDAVGNLYVADGTLKRVMVYDKEGKYQRAIGVDQLANRPSGVAVDAAGNRVYVVETGEINGNGHRVRVFDAHSGQHLLDIGKRGEKDGELNLPRDVALAPNGQVYVVDGGNFRVQVFEPDGRFVKTFGTVGQQSGQFSRPKEMAIDKEGRVYVVDAAFGNFQIFDAEGRLLLNVGSRGGRPDPAKFMLPAGIAVDQDGRVYMADQFHRKVDVFRPASLAPEAGFVARPAASPASGK
jgi:DNA-binding beta-propeller fold protein YncE